MPTPSEVAREAVRQRASSTSAPRPAPVSSPSGGEATRTTSASRHTGAAGGGLAAAAIIAARLRQQHGAASTRPSAHTNQRLLAYHHAAQAVSRGGPNSVAVGIMRNIRAVHMVAGEAGAARVGDLFGTASARAAMRQQVQHGAALRSMLPTAIMEHQFWSNTLAGRATQVGAETVGPGPATLGRYLGGGAGAAFRPLARAVLQSSAMSLARHPVGIAGLGMLSAGAGIGEALDRARGSNSETP